MPRYKVRRWIRASEVKYVEADNYEDALDKADKSGEWKISNFDTCDTDVEEVD